MTDQNYLETLVREGRTVPYMVHALFENKPDLNKDPLLQAMKQNCGNVELAESELFNFIYPGHISHFQEAAVPAQSVIKYLDEPFNIMQILGTSLIQTWDWPDAAEIALKTKTILAISDAFAGGLKREERLALFHGVVKSVLQQAPALAIHWIPSQRIVNPAAYVSALETEGIFSCAAINVRVFKVEGSAEEKVMDTMGLAAFGLSDLQCHFAGIDSSMMASLLYHYAEYLFQKGEVIRDGNTIQGLEPSDRWKCQHSESIVPPKRIVIDIHPGKHAMG